MNWQHKVFTSIGNSDWNYFYKSSNLNILKKKKIEVKDINNTHKKVKMFGYHGRCNRHTKSLLLAVKYGSWEGDTVGDTFFPNVGKNLEQDAGLQCTWETEPPTAKGFKDVQL